MPKNVIAYIGTDNYDIILYQSRILASLGKKVLIIDYSNTGSLIEAVPIPQGIDLKEEPLTFRHVDVVMMPLTSIKMNDYDDVLINCGFRIMDEVLNICTKIQMTVDMQPANIERLKHISSKLQGDKHLLIRDVLIIKIAPEQIAETIGMTKADTESLYFYETDLANAVMCQYDKLLRFVGISAEMREYLVRETNRLYPELKKTLIRSAYKKARRGGRL